MDSTSTNNTSGRSGGVVGTVALLLAVCGIVGAGMYAHHASNETTRLSRTCVLLERQCQALQDELNLKPDLNELLGSRTHREFIQKELATGSWHIPGKPGAKGAQGDKGPTGEPGGPQGAVGSRGLRGLQGRAGTRGVAGPQGSKGDAGGPVGPQGTEGKQGKAGPQGTKGDRGLAGAVGPQGPHGAQGLSGANGRDGTLPILELCASLVLAFLGIYLGKSLIDLYCRKYRKRHGSIAFEYEKGAWS